MSQTKVTDNLRSTTQLDGAKITTGTIPEARISTLTASKLTGALPAISGASLTNLPSDVTKATSDPVITTNPSGGVGTLYLNKNSGELWCCTDATNNENKWINIGGGSGDVVPYSFQGSTSGYAAGGWTSSAVNIIDKFSLTSDANSSDTGDLTGSFYYAGASTSNTHGYTSGGHEGSSWSNVIQKFAFATDGNATVVGDVTA